MLLKVSARVKKGKFSKFVFSACLDKVFQELSFKKKFHKKYYSSAKLLDIEVYYMLIVLIEGFGGKRALGILCKIELCQKRSKFRMQFCLGVLNNVLHVFSLKLASFLRYYVCEKTHFSEGIL